jgi:(p)ppGpp synthase/HD superfamily hydrolase
MEATTTERNRGTVLGPRFGEAVAYALEVHSGQCRAGTTQPYASHLLRVAGLVLEDGGGEPEAIAALLHDAAEDQGGTPRLWDIRRRFGPEVATIVKELTDSSEYPRPPGAAARSATSSIWQGPRRKRSGCPSPTSSSTCAA